MIDKRIFYCWFGHGEMSELNKRCIQSWHDVCPDYEILKIDESNFDYTITPYCKEAYEHGNWSYVSNTARLEILKHNSGFYLDTDVQLIRSLDDLRAFDNGFITEFTTSQPDSGVLGCGSGHCKLYHDAAHNLIPGSVLHKEFIKLLYEQYDIHGQSLTIQDDGFVILGEEWFPAASTGLITPRTIGIHYFEQTWIAQWRSISDEFYAFPKVIAYIANKLLYRDEDAEVVIQLKTTQKQLWDEDIMGRTLYFFNPKVVKLACREFEAQRLSYDASVPQRTSITPGGMLVTWLDE